VGENLTLFLADYPNSRESSLDLECAGAAPASAVCVLGETHNLHPVLWQEIVGAQNRNWCNDNWTLLGGIIIEQDYRGFKRHSC
jgi:hypothetical protein